MVLRAGYAALALQLQEAMDSGDALSANDIRSRLSDAINDAHRGTGTWAYYVDHFGDGESGDVIYCCDGDTCRASYSITDTAGAAKCVIDIEHAEDVVPRTVYEPEADEAEHYAAMEAALKTETLYTGLPVYERFISKAERDKAGSDDFAGKGKSFPILKPEDVKAAAASIGRAGPGNMGPSGIKARIIAIAKRKGWTAQLPKAWQSDSDTNEAAKPAATSGLKLIESFSFAEAETLELLESSVGTMEREIKIIAPGKGSTAFYPEEVLKRDAPLVFADKTQIYINHATKAEEAARPEGDWHKLVGALKGPAYWKEAGKYGKGAYAMAEFAADVAPSILAKAPWSGMSIRANGNAVMEAGRAKLQDGVPVLAEFTGCESIDIVTRAGAGGMILTEAAKAAIQTEEAAMAGSTEEATKLIEAAIAKAIAPYQQRLMRSDAREEATSILRGVSLPEPAKARIIERATANVPITADGAMDVTKLREAVVAEAKSEGEYLASLNPNMGRVLGMGNGPQLVAPKPEEIAAREAATAAELEADIRIYERQGMNRKAAEFAARGREEDVA